MNTLLSKMFKAEKLHTAAKVEGVSCFICATGGLTRLYLPLT